jgi:splicing factor 3B subunit 3
LQTIDLDENEAAFSIAVVPFAERGGEILLIVGTALEVTIAPRTCSKGFLRAYKISEDGRSLEFLNKVSDRRQIDDSPIYPYLWLTFIRRLWTMSPWLWLRSKAI